MSSAQFICAVAVEDTEFIRGDVNADGTVTFNDLPILVECVNGDIDCINCLAAADVNDNGIPCEVGDAVELADYLMFGSLPIYCLDAADANGDRHLDGSDPVFTIDHFFVPGSPPIPSPFPNCGFDPTPDSPDCGSHPCMNLPMSSVVVPRREHVPGNKVILSEARVFNGIVIVPLDITNVEPLPFFSYAIKYNPSVLRAVYADNSGLVTETFDFFNYKIDEEKGEITVGNSVSWRSANPLLAGTHWVANLAFEEIGKSDGPVSLEIKEVVFTDLEGFTIRP